MDYEELFPVVISPTKYKNTAFQEDLRFLEVQTFKKFCGKFQNRIPRDLNQNFDISRITSNFFQQKRLYKNVMAISDPGIQPRNDR